MSEMDLSIARKHLEKLYLDKATIIEFQEIEDPETHITTHEEIVVYENVPCKLSHHVPLTTGEGSSSSLSLSSYAMFSPDLVIKPGSKIIINRNGRETVFENSGEPAIHFNHQKIMLRISDKYA